MLGKRKPFKVQNERVEVIVSGIPALAHVFTYIDHPGMSDPRNAPSDLDYYGYSEIEFEMLDRRGYRAPWLDKKLDNPVIDECVRSQIREAMDDLRQARHEDAMEERQARRREQEKLFD